MSSETPSTLRTTFGVDDPPVSLASQPPPASARWTVLVLIFLFVILFLDDATG